MENICRFHVEPENAKSIWPLHVKAQRVIGRPFGRLFGTKWGGRGKGGGGGGAAAGTQILASRPPTHPPSPHDPGRASGKNVAPADHGMGPSLVTDSTGAPKKRNLV